MANLDKQHDGLSWRDFAWRAGWTVLAALFFAGLAPNFIVGEMLKRGTARIFLPLLGTIEQSGKGQNQITILTVDDTDLEEFGENWPVKFGFHIRRLKETLRHEPKAIFVDVLFLDDRDLPGAKRFADFLCEASQSTVVVLASGRALGYPSKTQDIILDRKKLDGSPCVLEAGVIVNTDKFDKIAWDYQVVSGKTNAHGPAHANLNQAPSATAKFGSPGCHVQQTAVSGSTS